MPLQANIPLQIGPGAKVPDFLGTYQDVRGRQQQQANTLQQMAMKKKSQEELQANRLSQLGMQQQTLGLKQDEANAAEKKRQLGVIASVGQQFLTLDDEQKDQQFGKFQQYLQRQGVDIPKHWEPSNWSLDAGRDIEGAIAQVKGAQGGGQFAPTKLQSKVDKAGYYLNFNPSTGAYKRALDEKGKPIAASENMRIIEQADGSFVRVSTRPPEGPESVPQTIPGVRSAGAATRALARKKMGISIDKMNIDLDKASKLALEGGQFKASQYEASTYGIRMSNTEKVMTGLDAEGFDRTTITLSLLNKAPELIKSGRLKRYVQAQRSFINATLRRESGAAIAQSEFDNAEAQYFPQVNDPPELLAQKKENRLVVQAAMRAEAGPAWGETMRHFDKLRGKKPSTTKKFIKVKPPSKSDQDLLDKYGIK